MKNAPEFAKKIDSTILAWSKDGKAKESSEAISAARAAQQMSKHHGTMPILICSDAIELFKKLTTHPNIYELRWYSSQEYLLFLLRLAKQIFNGNTGAFKENLAEFAKRAEIVTSGATSKPMAAEDFLQSVYVGAKELNKKLSDAEVGLKIPNLLPYDKEEDTDSQVDTMNFVLEKACHKFEEKAGELDDSQVKALPEDIRKLFGAIKNTGSCSVPDLKSFIISFAPYPKKEEGEAEKEEGKSEKMELKGPVKMTLEHFGALHEADRKSVV